jgi:sulfite reductase (ferredoxin)
MTTIETLAAEAASTRKKETAAQRVERIKRERAPWSILEDIKRYAREGFSSIPEEDLTVRFRAWGLYTQGDGRGTRGEEQPFFMMRVRTPNGLLTSDMVRTIANLSDRYARSSIDITNRQNFQLHWLRIEDIPTVWEELARVGWTSMGSCGDNTRTVTGCPLAGVESHEIIDASPFAHAVDTFLNGNADYANLPRKFKITITGCPHWCTYPEINDIGATAVRAPNGEVGFHIRIGGGLSTRPHLARLLPVFMRQDQLVRVIEAITAIFRDSDELRLNRAKARIKFLFINHGWTVEKFRDAIETRIGEQLAPAVDEQPPEGFERDHVGVHRQRQAGLYYAGFSVPSGRISPEQLRRVASLADEFGNGTLRTSAAQNIIALNIHANQVALLVAAASVADVPLTGATFQRGTMSCTGSEYCKLAITETKRFSIGLARELDDRLPGFSTAIRVHVTGCPNSCGQHWIADVGLQGVLLPVNGEQIEGFDFFLGGGVGRGSSIAKRVGFRAPADDVPDALERLFVEFRSSRLPTESFRIWSSRIGDIALREILVGSRTAVGAAVAV